MKTDNKDIFPAHIRKDGTLQTVKEHSKGVGVLCREYAIDEMKDICETEGIFHDVGKYQMTFKRRILGEPVTVEHSMCGAKEAIDIYGKNIASRMISICIAGHHTGLPDFGTMADVRDLPTYFGRMARETEDYSRYKSDLTPPKIDHIALQNMIAKHCKTQEEAVEAYAFLTRYCFSCLVDADTVDTMTAEGVDVPAPLTADFDKCLALINKRLSSFRPITEVQKARGRLQAQAFANVEEDADIYLMEMPTGSGKTLAGTKCALTRALKSGKKRIIYIIPYNSIIDQTAKEFEDIFGDSAQILRHQSSFSYEDAEDMSEEQKRAAIYGCENWNAEIIITTAVQFYESMFSSRRRKLRKIHNVADSVLVFDEAHLMPLPYLQPCLRSVVQSVRFLHCEAIFLTATMPDYAALINRYTLKDTKTKDLITDKSDFRFFKKNIYMDLGTITKEDVVNKAAEYGSSLIVAGSRKKARELYKACRKEKYLLTRHIKVADIEEKIKEIRHALKKLREDYPDMKNIPPDRQITVVSTSIIEAGVDLDFEAAFRDMAGPGTGLDNALQTGGRANREGLFDTGYVYLFTLDDDKSRDGVKTNITRGILKDFADISSTEAIKAYYDRLYRQAEDEITSHSLYGKYGRGFTDVRFRSYDEDMRLIESSDVSVIACTDDAGRRLVEEGKRLGFINERKAQKHCFSVSASELKKLISLHAVEEIGGMYVLTSGANYSKEYGVLFPGTNVLFYKKISCFTQSMRV